MAENFNDVSEAFTGWLSTITGERITGAYVNGVWVPSAPTVLSFLGVVQNTTPKDLKVLPEGGRTEEVIKIHTKFELIPQEDYILYDNANWLVNNVANRKIGGYYKVICTRQG